MFMQLIRVEKHMVRNFIILDELSFIAKNFYNQANYLVRQEFISTSREKEQGLREHANFIGYYDLEKLIKSTDDYESYCRLPAQARQAILKVLEKNWKSFFRSIKDWVKNKSKYRGKPNLPKYLKKQGRKEIIIPGQNILIKEGKFRIPKLILVKLHPTQ